MPPFGRSAAAETSLARTPSALRSGRAVPSGSKSATDFTVVAGFAAATRSAKTSRALQSASLQRKAATSCVVEASATNDTGTCAVPPAFTTTLPDFFVSPAFQAQLTVRSWRWSLTITSDFSTVSPAWYESFTVVNSRPGPAIQPSRSA